MPEKYKNKYRIQSHRMPGWDYSGNGMYFITLVTQNRDCNLGEIVKNKIILSDFGIIVKNEWEISFEIRDELFCDDYIDKHNLDIPKYNRNNHFFQSNYHDHIIRNEVSFQRIKNYIINNPLKWNNDNLFE
jgi:REP element-mobilizing transposase RayT